MSFAPLVLFTYNRPWHVEQTLEALRRNKYADKSELFIYCDGPKEGIEEDQFKKIQKVREIARKEQWFQIVHVIEQEKNKGLANSIIDGVTEIVNRFEKVIVIEDDVLTSPYFLSFMNEGLNFYRDEEKVLSIGSWNYFSQPPTHAETFFLRNPDSIGWATWKRAWNYFEADGVKLLNDLRKLNLVNYFNMDGGYNYEKMLQNQIDGKVNSWAIRWAATTALKKGLTLYPVRSLTKHIGFGTSATNCTENFDYNKKLTLSKLPVKIEPIELKENNQMLKGFIDFEIQLRKQRARNVGFIPKVKGFMNGMVTRFNK